MRKISPGDVSGSRAWDATNIERFMGATTVRAHWTNQPYQWHVNDGPEVFVVLDGKVEMHTRKNGELIIHALQSGDIFHAEEGDEHMAHPHGQARVLVIEQEGSI